MQQTWRWFGPNDPISLEHIKHTGATGVVTSLHGYDTNSAWAPEAIAARKRIIKDSGLTWSVVESIPIHPMIKLGNSGRTKHIDNYITTIHNLAAAGVQTICYNFMPVLGWTRTDLNFQLPNGAVALRFDLIALAAYDLFVLQRKGAENSYSDDVAVKAEQLFANLSSEALNKLEKTLISGLPGTEQSHGTAAFRSEIDRFSEMSPSDLRANLIYFLRKVIPAAEEVGSKLCIHPDDPPFSLFGLPRVVGCHNDLSAIFNAVPSIANGLTLCTGSFGVLAENDLPAMAFTFRKRIHFTHLRNVKREPDSSFYEAGHLDGDIDMIAVISILLDEEKRRSSTGQNDWEIPMRPDHGHVILDDSEKTTNPGYSAIGRLKGLAELRGVMRSLAWSAES